ncbi:MAG: hypothetical protein GEU71_00490 [Actinobacteria bacterium]|nr:hypothetical protein [Actinomycetota bacterium]
MAMEEKTAAFYLVEGLQALNALDKGTSFYPLAFGLVASGLERLLKLVIILESLRFQGVLPDKQELRTHDLLKLSEVTLRPMKSSAAVGRELLEKDPILTTLLIALNDFATEGRYLYMDGVLTPRRPALDPHKSFQQVEKAVLRSTSSTGEARHSKLFGYVLTGMGQTYVRRRNELIVGSLVGFLKPLVQLFVECAGTTTPGYLRILLDAAPDKRLPTRAELRKVVNSHELEEWEAELEHCLVDR